MVAAREGASTAISASQLASPVLILSMTPPAHAAQTLAAATVPATAMLCLSSAARVLPQTFPTAEEWSDPPLLQQLEEMLQRHESRSGGALSALANTHTAVLSPLQQCGDGSR